jgi:hypothetical protein
VKEKPFKVGETVIEWAGSFGRYPAGVRTIKKTFKLYVEDNFGTKWRYDGFAHPKSYTSSRKLERVTEEALQEIRVWRTKRSITKVIDEVVRRVRRDELSLEQLEAVLDMCLRIVPDEERTSAENEDDDFVQLLEKHKPKNKPVKDVPLHIILSWLKGKNFKNVRGVDAHDFVAKTAASVE